MTDQPAAIELDPTPLVLTMIEKSKAGKLKWQPTADERAFIASVGGDTTLKITKESVEHIGGYGNPEMIDTPVLFMLDSKGRTLWEIHSSQVHGGLWVLYNLAQRIGNKLDERMANLIEVLQRI